MAEMAPRGAPMWSGAAAYARASKLGLTVVAAAVVCPVLAAGQRFGFVSDVPVWMLVGAMVLGTAGTRLSTLVWPPGGSARGMEARIAIGSATVGLIIYLTGWGAMLAVGFIFMAAEELRVEGSRAARPSIGGAVAATAIGELAVAAGVHTYLPLPQGHGLAALVTVGTCLIIAVLGISYAEKERVEGSLRRSEERLSALVQHASDIIMVIEADGTVVYASPAVERVLGYAPVDLGRFSNEVVHPDHLADARALFVDAMAHPGQVAWVELPLRHTDGSYQWFDVGITNRVDDPSVGGLVCNMRDVTERRLAQEQLQFQAHHDPLTRLPNRWRFLDQLEQALFEAATTGRHVAVFFLDMDRFKLVNDSLGHEVGDRMLVAVAERLASCLRPGDSVARFGGDEFTILLGALATPDHAIRVAERITEQLRQPVVLGEHELFVSASIGIALSHGGQERAGDLLRQADVAMYLAKEKGRSRWELFDPTSAPHVMDRLELEGDLWRAIDHKELVIHFQPEIDLATGNVVAAEALARWQHPRRGLLEPDAFVPFAEESTLIVSIDRLVLREACTWARRWSQDRVGTEPLVVSVNLSPRFMRQAEVVADITAALRETGVDPRCIQIEITERSALTDLDNTCSQLHQLRALGVRIAIDDFGTGYSSLAYLKRLPIDTLKLDRSFLEGIATGPADLAIVQAVITMGHALGMKVTAEGVERPEEAARLRDLGCDAAMGWLWSPAVPAEDLVARVRAGFAATPHERTGVVVPLRARA